MARLPLQPAAFVETCRGTVKLLFVSNLFPDQTESWRGLDNATLLHAMRDAEPRLEIRVLAFRPSLTRFGPAAQIRPRPGDEILNPLFFWNNYLPKLGGLNHRIFARALARAESALPADFQPDVILAPWLFPDACAAAIRAMRRNIPVVAVAQGSDVHQYLEMPMRRRAILKLAKQARKIVTRSRDLQSRLIACGAEAGRVCTIYNGVDTGLFRPAPTLEARIPLGIPAEGRLLLFVGNFLPVKGIDLILSAFALVRARSSVPTKLALIGGGPLETALRGQAAELGISEHVIFAGRQPPSAVARWMQAADAVCLASHNEGVPNVLFESISSGRPMVSTDVGGIAEIVEPLMSRRFLVTHREPRVFAAALLDALDNPPDENSLRQKALPFSWESCARNYLSLLFPSDPATTMLASSE
jgi:glycosyltransferase involved in cell wall biosynthesis